MSGETAEKNGDINSVDRGLHFSTSVYGLDAIWLTAMTTYNGM